MRVFGANWAVLAGKANHQNDRWVGKPEQPAVILQSPRAWFAFKILYKAGYATKPRPSLRDLPTIAHLLRGASGLSGVVLNGAPMTEESTGLFRVKRMKTYESVGRCIYCGAEAARAREAARRAELQHGAIMIRSLS